jgi:adenylate cyclase
MADRAVSLTQLMSETPLYRWRRLVRHIPSEPRCQICYVPFGGLGRVFRLAGYAPTRKNPNFCNQCFEKAPLGGEEMDVGILFADVRGFTTDSESLTPKEVQARLSRFYRTATSVLISHDAVIDKLVGDEVMALFIPLLIKGDAIQVMVSAAEELLSGVGFGPDGEPWVALGVGLDFGTAYVGNVGSDEVLKDFTALGDVVNTASRLQSVARAGQIVMSERVYGAVQERFPDAEPMKMDLRGKAEPVPARVIDLAATTRA